MLFGPDISNYQRNIDLSRVRAEGFDFLFAKCTEGASYRSPDYPRQRDQGIRAGLIFAAYHYVTTDDPVAQARNFAGWVGDRKIAVMFDWEKGGGNGPWLRRVVAAFRGLGLNCALDYAPRWYWSSQGSPNLQGLPSTVASSYPSTATGAASDLYTHVTTNRWASYGGMPVAVLQFTDRARIAGMSVDCNAYPGTRDQLISLLYGTPVAPVPAVDANVEELMSQQTFDALDKNIQIEAECGAGSMAFQECWVIVSIPDGSANFTLYPAFDKSNGQSDYVDPIKFRLDKSAGYRRNAVKMPANNTDCCVQWFAATTPVTVSVVHTPKRS